MASENDSKETKNSWEDIAKAKRAALWESIPDEWLIPSSIYPPDDQLDVTTFPEKSGWFTPKELEITGKTATELLKELANGTLSSYEVTEAFCKRAAAAHQLTNCLTDTFFPTALQQAKILDAHLKEHNGTPVGPLHGLPISLKDNFNVRGADSTLGFVSWANQPMPENSPLVTLLQKAGAIVYVKTNVPTAMMIAETVNNLFGRTLNPLNRSLAAGGSSGGEAALVAFGGSPLGVGSDIGGSLRIPAACCGGLVTLRPSFGRFPTVGTRSGLAGQEAVQSVNGPLAHSIADLRSYSEAVIGMRPERWDPRCLPLPWRKEAEVEPSTKLKLAVMWDDGVVRPTPPVARALKETVEKLKAAGHEVVEWSSEGHLEGVQMLGKMFTADGGKSVKKLLEPVGEPIRPELSLYDTAEELGVYDMWQLQGQRTQLATKYLERWNACEGLDAVLCPTTPYATVMHGDFTYVGYTGIWNVLDYSAVSFPSGIKADGEKDAQQGVENPLSKACEKVQEKYSSLDVHGQPVSLQLVARRLEEEKLLSMTDIVMKAL